MLGSMMLAAGVVLHHLVEARFRHRRPARPVLGYALAAGLMVLVPLGAMQLAIPWRTGQNTRTLAQAVETALSLSRDEALAERFAPAKACRPGCAEPQPGLFNVLIIGNSHGTDGFNALAAVYPQAHLIPSWRASCMYMVGAGSWFAEHASQVDAQTRQTCTEAVERTYADHARLGAMDLIVFSYQSNPNYPPLLDETLGYLRSITAAPILVFGNAPAFTQPLPDIVYALGLSPADRVPEDRVSTGTWAADAPTEAIARRHGAGFVSRLDYLCPERHCRAFTADGSRLITYDQHHLSLAAAREFGLAQADAIRAEVARQFAVHEGDGDAEPGAR